MRAVWQFIIKQPKDAPDMGELVGKKYVDVVKLYNKSFSWSDPLPPETGYPCDAFDAKPAQIAELDFSHVVTKIDVEKTDRKADMCTVILFDPKNIFANILDTGLQVKVTGGWSNEDGAGVLFEGIIHEVRSQFKSGNRSTCTIICLEDMIMLGGVEEDDPMISAGGDEDAPDAPDSDPEQGTYPEIIMKIAQRHPPLKCDEAADIKLTSAIPKNTKESPNQGAKQTDLARLYELAEQCYAAVYVENGHLKFYTLTHIFDTFKPICDFLFRDTSSSVAPGFTNDVFAASKTRQVYVEDVTITNGRPRKKIKIEAGELVIKVVDKTSSPDNPATFFYRPDSEKLEKLSVEDQNFWHNYFSPTNIKAKLVTWENVKKFCIRVDVEGKPESESEVKGSNKEKLVSDDRVLNTGVQLNLPIGWWKLRPIQVATVLGLGGKYSGLYYLSTVSHSLSAQGYSCKVSGFRYDKDLPGPTVDTQQTSGAQL